MQVKYATGGGTRFTPPINHHNGVFNDYAVLGEELEGGLCCGVPPGNAPWDYVCDDVDSEQDCVDNYPGRDFQADIEVIEGVAVLFLSDGGSADLNVWSHMLENGGVKSAYYTIGFGDADGINTQLELLSSSTEGHYFPASDLDALNFIIDTLLQQS